METVQKERIDLSQIAENGWRQGCCLSISENNHLSDKNGAALKEGLYLLISQNCDIVNADKEPYVELLFIKLKNVEHDLTHGKNPRKLHVKITQDSDKYVECLPYDRIFFCKENLAHISPHDSFQLQGDDLKILINWLVKRYSRPAFPDAFNQRIRNVKKKIRDIMKSYAMNARGLYLRLNTENELSEKEAYKLTITMLVDPEYSEGKSSDQIKKGLEEIVACFETIEGIKITSYTDKPAYALLSTKEICLHDFEELQPIDFDHLSFSG